MFSRSIKSEKSTEDEEDFIIDESFSSDYYGEGFRTSSSSSLKWSADARKQNEEDWLSIERILYGEENLPEGKYKIFILSIFLAFESHKLFLGKIVKKVFCE